MQVVSTAGFRAGQRTCVLWEGVFSYLTIEAIDATLAWISATCGASSRLILTYVEESVLQPTEDKPPWIAAVRKAGEPFLTGLDPRHAAGFFAKYGLRLVSDESTRASAVRLAPTVAETIPGFYRVALLELTRHLPESRPTVSTG